jgi:hypothetical protein
MIEAADHPNRRLKPMSSAVQTPPPAEQLPPLPDVPRQVSLDGSVRQAFAALCQELHRCVVARCPDWAKYTSPQPPYRPLSPSEFEAAFCFLEKGSALDLDTVPTLGQYGQWDDDGARAVRQFLRHPGLPPVAAVRLLQLTRHCGVDRQRQWWFHGIDELLREYWKHHEVGFPLGLRELARVFEAAGIPPEAIGCCRLQIWQWHFSFIWDAAATWPYFAEHQDLIALALDLETNSDLMGEFTLKYCRPERHQAAFEVLATFPRLPERFVETCWNAALGTVRAERSFAQMALDRFPDKTARVIGALANGKQEVRAAAADWLGRMGDSQAVEPLKRALKKEKYDGPRGTIMAALERLGVPLDEFLDRSALAGEAETGLRKGVPEELSWFPFAQLPAVHWEDTGQQIPPAVLQWWIVQAHKLKTPEPGVLLRRYAGLMRRTEASALGLFVLSAWVAHDTTLPSEEQAKAQAQKFTQQWGAQHYDMALQNAQQTPVGSAVPHKGILAIAAACCDGRAVPLVGDYLKRWYGMRAAQCKALIQTIAWIEHPAAVQLLLSTARRFRTAGIRKEAEAAVQRLAERRDWTIAELADRSISTCGLDDDDQLVLDYGPRRFLARLNDDLAFALFTAEGEPIAALPEPRKDEDADQVKKVKKQLADAKKELKTVVKQQQERLYEAMCEQRAWSFGDWDAFLRRHAIVGRLCQRLIWVEEQKSGSLHSFRPLADGSLTDAADQPVELAADAVVRLAHSSVLTPADAERWRSHLADYEVVPAFDQLGKPVYRLPDTAREESEIRDFKGHMLEAFKLRGQAGKLGYARGSAEDGGRFYRYSKQFPTLGLEVSIEFSGNQLPEDNVAVALVGLTFQRTVSPEAARAGAPMAQRVRLADVPSVLLSECYDDMRTIAAQGSGFDADWQKKVNR